MKGDAGRSKDPSWDVLVVGAGIVGAACADALAREGLQVLVVDPNEPGQGATAACMGHIVVMDDSEAQFALTRYSSELWRKLAPQLPKSAEWDPSGTLWIARDDAQLREVERKRNYYETRGVEATRVDGRELTRLEPELRSGLAGALRTPLDASVYPPVVTRWLLERAKARGAEMRVGTAVDRLDERGAVLVGGERLGARFVVNAAGVGALGLLEVATPKLELHPRKGHLAITDRYPGRVRHQLVELGYLTSAHALHADSVAFNLQPRPTGQLLIGSSRQFTAAPGVETAVVTRMVERALEFVPGLRQTLVIRSWIGFRPATPDKLPYIGALDAPNVLLATGHEGLGITTSLGTAELILDAILGRASAIDRSAYSPSRAPKKNASHLAPEIEAVQA